MSGPHSKLTDQDRHKLSMLARPVGGEVARLTMLKTSLSSSSFSYGSASEAIKQISYSIEQLSNIRDEIHQTIYGDAP